MMMVVSWLRRLSSRVLGFDPRPMLLRFLVNKVALGQYLLRLLLVSPVIISPCSSHYLACNQRSITLAIQSVVTDGELGGVVYYYVMAFNYYRRTSGLDTGNHQNTHEKS